MSNKPNSSSLDPWLIGDQTVDDCLANANLVRCSMLILAMLTAVCGLVTNAINLTVFYLQGFRDSVQVSLAALAISDIFTNVTMAVFSCTVLDSQLCLYLYLPASLRFSTSWLVYALSLNSSCVAVFIAVERCLCTTIPLKVKDVITPGRSFFIVSTIGVISLAAVSPSLSVISSHYLQPEVSEGNFSSADQQTDGGTPVGIAVSNAIVFNTQSVALVCLLVSTIILVIVLRRRSRWRGTFSATSTETVKTGRRKDERVHVMVVVVSAILLTCYIPGQLFTLVSLADEDFAHGERHHYLYHAMWSVSYFLYTLNASVNLVVYYNMSSRYRETLDRLMTFKHRQ